MAISSVSATRGLMMLILRPSNALRSISWVTAGPEPMVRAATLPPSTVLVLLPETAHQPLASDVENQRHQKQQETHKKEALKGSHSPDHLIGTDG